MTLRLCASASKMDCIVTAREKGNQSHVCGGSFDRRANAALEFKNSDEMCPKTGGKVNSKNSF